jgi:hypothetical protein
MRRGTVEDIPLDAPRKPVTGEKVDSTEFGRNVANTLSALGPGKLAGIGAIGMQDRSNMDWIFCFVLIIFQGMLLVRVGLRCSIFGNKQQEGQ